MSLKKHFALMADYNAWMNDRLYAQASELTQSQRQKDMGAFFQSIEGTLNHLMVADLIWLGRFKTHPSRFPGLDAMASFPRPAALDAPLYADFQALSTARRQLDEVIGQLVEETEEQDFAVPLHYRNSKGVPATREFGALLQHLFNHQTHHRGQVTTLFSQLGVEVGVTDLLVRIPDQGPQA